MVTFEGFKQMSSNIGLVWFFGFFSQTGFFSFFFLLVISEDGC